MHAITLTYGGDYCCNQNVLLMSVSLKNMRSEHVYFQAEVPMKFEFTSIYWISLNHKFSESQQPKRSSPQSMAPRSPASASSRNFLEMQILWFRSRSPKSEALLLGFINSRFYQTLETIWCVLRFDNHCLSMVWQRTRA